MAGPISGLGGALNLPPTLTIALLTEGSSALTTVRGKADGPFILVNDSMLPLADSGLKPGDTVRVTRLPGEGDALRFDVAKVVAGAAGPEAADALPVLMARLSQIAGRSLPESLVPPGLHAGDAVRQLVALFQDSEGIGPQLEQLANTLKGLKLPGHPSVEAFNSLMAQLGALHAEDPAQLASLLKALVQKRAPEAQLLGASAEELAALADEDLASVLLRLRDDPAVRAALQQAGTLDEFLSKTGSILDRLGGARAQQLHGAQQGYVFLELPLPKEAGFHHAAAHFYQEGRAKPGQRDAVPSVAVLDLNLTQLGPLWISVRAFQGTCQCEMLAASPATAEVLGAASGEMAEALHGAGYAEVQVRAGAWDGDRIGKTAGLLGGLRPLDVSA